ncbi:MAG: hydroxymethylpyrimidine/phosphomethylpyrimidine kinase [Aquificae bacterium]|nr:hydroxymethylpyrimidine/phosphomethylpyrimidine kinase [Aquificota bacterium]
MNRVGLTVAGLDPSGGAGILLDQRVFSHFGVFAAGVITANTVQNSCGARHWKPVDEKLFTDQLRALKEDLPVGVIKVGMLARARFLEVLLDAFGEVPAVVDPVLASKNGLPLVDEPAVYLRLAPRIFLFTPNWDEARRLTGLGGSPTEVLQKLKEFGFKNVLLKGGHMEGDRVRDYLLLESGELLVFSKPRVAKSPRGTGCALSSAIAALFLKTGDLKEAALRAEEFLKGALERAERLGRCHEFLTF